MAALKRLKGIKITVICLIIIVICGGLFQDTVTVQADPFEEIEAKLSGVSQEEKEILENLFKLSQEIQIMELEEKKLSGDMESINKEIHEIEASIKAGEISFLQKQESLKQVLRSYQRMGPGSFMEILMDSDSLSTFLQRINTLRDLARNTGELMDQLEKSGEKLKQDKMALTEKLRIVEEKQKQAKEALAKKLELRKEKEAYLESLKGAREYYQEYLSNIEKVWSDMKLLFKEAAAEFTRIVEKGNIPTEALKLKFSFTEIRGAIEDSVINKVISEQSTLPKMVFSFHTGRVDIELPDNHLELTGTFAIEDGHKLRFEAQKGSFYGLPLEAGSLEELLGEGNLVLDIEPLLAGNSINGLEIKEGQLELISKFKLF